MKDWWEEKPYEVKCQIAEGIPSYLKKNQWTELSRVLHQNPLFLMPIQKGLPSVQQYVLSRPGAQSPP